MNWFKPKKDIKFYRKESLPKRPIYLIWDCSEYLSPLPYDLANKDFKFSNQLLNSKPHAKIRLTDDIITFGKFKTVIPEASIFQYYGIGSMPPRWYIPLEPYYILSFRHDLPPRIKYNSVKNVYHFTKNQINMLKYFSVKQK